MEFTYISKNGTLVSSNEAAVPISNIEFSYGFGVYETIRITHRKGEFIDDHLERLMHSAA
ncbi:MAG: hypothetical protein RIQ56_89, partial [Candidatus Parcubacteria bacterium]